MSVQLFLKVNTLKEWASAGVVPLPTSVGWEQEENLKSAYHWLDAVKNSEVEAFSTELGAIISNSESRANHILSQQDLREDSGEFVNDEQGALVVAALRQAEYSAELLEKGVSEDCIEQIKKLIHLAFLIW